MLLGKYDCSWRKAAGILSCPVLLLPAVELTAGARDLRYFCQACPYVYRIKQKVVCLVLVEEKLSRGAQHDG
jgi:hypothetical protein